MKGSVICWIMISVMVVMWLFGLETGEATITEALYLMMINLWTVAYIITKAIERKKND